MNTHTQSSAAQQATAPTNTRELRAFLVEQMQGVANGRVNSEKAKSICNLAQQVYNTLNVEIKVAVARTKLKDGDIAPVSFVD
jgi:hypothetical protein